MEEMSNKPYNVYSPPNRPTVTMIKSKTIRKAVRKPSTTEMGNAYKFWLESLKKGPIVRPRHRWENNIKIHLKEIGLEEVD
jgi:hypothetical protein